eukprot:TRINITY_DN60541_c0_g1_i1.p1 TRINITY_DN60541_c0_g1~~TRINITY_DN60541_c0_g1_i1.p1  ORF type:complete len:1147 (-),score=316.60 TRINITY_DN60541_c0_g1_i1:39-3479(-)
MPLPFSEPAPKGVAEAKGQPLSDDALREVLEKVRADALKGSLQLPSGEAAEESQEPPAARCQRDALLLLSNFTEISVEEASQSKGNEQAIAERQLALKLTKDLLESCQSTSKPFVAAVRRLFSVSLTRNSLMSSEKLRTSAIQVVEVIARKFGEALSYELGVYIDQIVIPVLSSGNSNAAQKAPMLKVSKLLCAQSSAMLALFLSFDCDLEKKNVLERLIDIVSRIARGKYTETEHVGLIQPEQEQRLRVLALQTLLQLITSLDQQGRASEAQAGSGAAAALASSPSSTLESEAEQANGDATPQTSRSSSTLLAVEQKQRKRELQEGVSKFNLKPKRGLEHLKSAGLLVEDPDAYASLFRKTHLGLNKTTIGDYLGEDKSFNKKVLDSLLDSMDFSRTEFDEALRQFLAIFRLPGEGQKIDRIVQHFAAKYIKDNPEGRFNNADVIYVLAYSVMMLQTSLHKPSVKDKDRMTKAQFIANNRGIDNGKDVPQEYLSSLYDTVQKTPFSLQEDEDLRSRQESIAARNASEKAAIFQREVQGMMASAEELMGSPPFQSSESSRSTLREEGSRLAGAVFEVACWPVLASLSLLLADEKYQDEVECINICCSGFRQCVRTAARLNAGMERDAIVTSLAKFTKLTTFQEMKQKNIECIRVLLEIGISEGNNLGSSWQYVLHCISQLERLQLLKNKGLQDYEVFDSKAVMRRSMNDVNGYSNGSTKHRSNGLGISAMVPMREEDAKVDLLNAESVMAQIDIAQIDKIFDRSTQLEHGAVLHFLGQMAKVSQEELACQEQPRIFSMQKLSETAMSNLQRPTEVRSEIWQIVSRHFVDVASQPQMKAGICQHAFDLLRQLAVKFWMKEEPSKQASFGDVMLAPFEKVLASKHTGGDVKGLVVEFVKVMVGPNAKRDGPTGSPVSSVGAGWPNVFRILRIAAQDQHSSKAVLESAFSVLKIAADRDSEFLLQEANFLEGVAALRAFGRCHHLPTTLQSLELLVQIAQVATDSSGAETSASSTEARLQQLLDAAASAAGDTRAEVREQGVRKVYSLLRKYGCNVFDSQRWSEILERTIEPLWKNMVVQLQQGDKVLVPVAAEVIAGLQELPTPEIQRYLPKIFPALCSLVSVPSPEVRIKVQELLTRVCSLVCGEQA